MRIGRPGQIKSRREQRREKEQDKQRQQGEGEVLDQPKQAALPKFISRGFKPAGAVNLSDKDALSPRSGFKLPNQKALIKGNIRLLQPVDIVLPVTGDFAESAVVRRGLIQDFDKQGRLVVSQPQPALGRSLVGKKLDLTFLNRYRAKVARRWLRVGYTTVLRAIVNGYDLGNGVRDDVLIFNRPKKLALRSLRLSYRLTPPEDVDLRLYVWPDGQELGLMDISLDGARFHHDSRLTFPKRKMVRLQLRSGELSLVIDAEPVRYAEVRDRHGLKRKVTCVRIDNKTKQTEVRLRELVSAIYRHLLAQRSGLE